MSTLFALIFLAALVGIAKPFIQGMQRKHFAIAAGLSFVLIGIAAPKPKKVEGEQATASKMLADRTSIEEDAKEPAPPARASKWQYVENRDEMRNSTSKTASVRSENEVEFDFPYGETGATLWVRKDPKFGLDVAFQVDSGQILCHSFGDSKVWIKFDDKPIQTFTCTDASDGSSETAFLLNDSRALAELRKAKKTIIEAEFFQEGRQQFIFNTQNLEWE